MQYETKRQRVTKYLRFLFNALKENGRTGSFKGIVANASLELGVSEKDIEPVIHTFEHANIIEIDGDDIVV